MKKNKIHLFIAMLFCVNILTACSNDISLDSSDNDEDQGVVDQVSDDVGEVEALTIGHSCIGCGNCIHADSEHFSRESGQREPVVISQDNLDSSALAMAIKRCPANAIKLN